jgi:hypothetical protein
MSCRRDNSGFASILALIFLAVFASLAIAFMSAANGALLKSQNQTNVQNALMSAESGLAFHSYVLKQIAMPTGVSGQALITALYDKLSTQSQIVGNLGSSALSYSGTSAINIASMNLEGHTFDAQIMVYSGTSVSLKVTGHSGNISRCVTISADMLGGGGFCPATGVVSRGAVSLIGNAQIKGSDTTAGSLYTFATATTVFTTNGNTVVQGLVNASNAAATASLTGNYSIGGKTGSAAYSSINFGAAAVDVPECDPTVFAPYATNIVDTSTSTTGAKTFTNIRIKANTNPTFLGNITIKGVVYIEKPNKVTFSGNLNLTGLIVSDTGHDTTNNQINFSGNTTIAAVETLPDTADFHELRDLTGAFLLAPGFTTKFTGNFGTVNGIMASEAFTFTGNAGGTVRGSLISYGDSPFSLSGNSSLYFDHTAYTGEIPGLGGSPKFALKPTTYVESSH